MDSHKEILLQHLNTLSEDNDSFPHESMADEQRLSTSADDGGGIGHGEGRVYGDERCRLSGVKRTLTPQRSLKKKKNLINRSNSSANTNNNYCQPIPDINAMSVASLYDRDYGKEMGEDADTPSISECPAISQTRPENYSPYVETKNLKPNSTLFFSDGLRSIDFILAWSPDDDEETEMSNKEKRKIFEQNLIEEGLELERDVFENEIYFVKIHAPLEVLRRYAEILKLRLPMKESLCRIHKNDEKSNAALYITQKIPGFEGVRNKTSSIYSAVKLFGNRLAKTVFVDEDHFPAKYHNFTAVYSRDKEYLFDVQQPKFFTAAIRSRICKFILDRKSFSQESLHDEYAFGIDRLITDGIYKAGYPLHDGEVHLPGSLRYLLCKEWAAVSKFYRYQPMDYIREYFGVKIGLYFAWLGYYTYMLSLASIVGVACFAYSWSTMDQNKPVQDICSGELDIKMCPLCDHWCDYWELKETCTHAKITYLIDNPTTVFFAVFMSFWATLFLELWKRYSAEITHRWDLTGFDIHEEHPRPHYLARLAHVKKIRIDYVTNAKEPQPPFWRMKLPATVFSFSVVLLLVAMAVAAVLGVVLYRMSMLAALSVYGDTVTTSGAILFTTATAATINLCLIFVFNWVYTWVAEYLTEFELLRTQTEFDDSLTLKIYLLQFVNYYASIFYIAFFKGKFIGYPGDYNRFFKFRQEECSVGGCLMELCIQLGIIMVGKQSFNTMLEMIIPKIQKWFKSLTMWKKKRTGSSVKKCGQRWVRDLKLIEWGPRSLFAEYLEMVLQYGFVTIFVAAFPLAPFFALLNNILEMRLDAKKLLTFYRRPVTQRVRNIGVWYRILDSIGKLSVITNGFIIAFTSDFIPRLVYRIQLSEDGSLNGYLNSSLSYFNTSDLQAGSAPHRSDYNAEICRYPDYREPPWAKNRYDKTALYWNILAARLAFVVVFENIVAMVMIFVRWCIPDTPAQLRDQIRREAYITNEIIIKQESTRARNENIEEFNDKMKLLIMNENLSASQVDLVIHDKNSSTSPNNINVQLRNKNFKNISKAFIEEEMKDL